MNESSVGTAKQEESPDQSWPIRLFRKSVLKQRKYQEVVSLLGETEGLSCLDIGSDNGVISYLLRQKGGKWKSADLEEQAIASIRELVGDDVYQLDGGTVPFGENEFDKVVIVDFLEHIPDDAGFLQELHRVIKPGGKLIINVPNLKNSLLRRFRLAIGQTDEKHGHLRPGYTRQSIQDLLKGRFAVESSHTYSKFFSEAVDTMLVFALSLLKRKEGPHTQKGILVTGQDLNKLRSSFRLYSLIYPVVWLFAQLDRLLFFQSGYMMIVKARVEK